MGTDVEIVKYLAPLGIGGALAYLMFAIYRKDVIRWAEDHRDQAKIMMDLVAKTTETVANNTAAVQHLMDYIKTGRGQ